MCNLTGPSPAQQKHETQTCFDFEQRQNRAWLHHQVLMPDRKGIDMWQHDELLNFFSASTLENRSRPPLAIEGVKLSWASQQHLARLNEERDNAKVQQGIELGTATRVANWWDNGKQKQLEDKKLKRKGEHGQTIGWYSRHSGLWVLFPRLTCTRH